MLMNNNSNVPTPIAQANPNIPAVYVDWTIPDNITYDRFQVSWKCRSDRANRYWCVLYFLWGYAGFQHIGSPDGNSDTYITNFALFDRTAAEAGGTGITSGCEEISGFATSHYFDTEGTGYRIVGNINWTPGVWYDMCICAKTVADKTYFSQWYLPAGGSWTHIGTLYMDRPDLDLTRFSSMQEDWNFDGDESAFVITKAYGRNLSNQSWSCFNSGKIVPYYCDNGATVGEAGANFTFRILTATNLEQSVFVSSGLLVRPVPPPNQRNFTLTGLPAVPASTPNWEVICRKYIRNAVTNGKCITSSTSQPLSMQTFSASTTTKWQIRDAGDGYFYLVSPASNTAITASGTSNGSSVTASSWSNGSTNQNQMWKFDLISDRFYRIVPKSAPTLALTIGTANSQGMIPLKLTATQSNNTNQKWELWNN